MNISPAFSLSIILLISIYWVDFHEASRLERTSVSKRNANEVINSHINRVRKSILNWSLFSKYNYFKQVPQHKSTFHDSNLHVMRMTQVAKKLSFKKTPSFSKSEPKQAVLNSNLSSSTNDLRNRKSMNTASSESTTILEAEYIKSLQQQIYLLELENNHLRQQTLKATEIQPMMTAEATKMLENLKTLQKKVNSLELELFRKEGHVDLLNSKIIQLTTKIENETDKHGREKQAMLGESINSKRDLDQFERELNRKNMTIKELKDDLQRNSSNLHSAENKIEMLRAQLQEEMVKAREAELELSHKKSEMLQVNSKLRELEDNYTTNNNHLHENVKKELRGEIMFLKKQLRESTECVDKEQTLKNQISEDANKLIKENAILHRQIIELQTLIEQERSLREKFDNRRHLDNDEVIRLRDKEKELEFKSRKLQSDLETEKSRVARLMEELSKQDQVYSHRMLDDNLNKKRILDDNIRNIELLEENEKLKRDKENLIEYVDSLQLEIKKREKEITETYQIMKEMESRVAQLENLKSLDDVIQSKRWGEMEQTIDALKTQAKLMASMSQMKDAHAKTDRLKWNIPTS